MIGAKPLEQTRFVPVRQSLDPGQSQFAIGSKVKGMCPRVAAVCMTRDPFAPLKFMQHARETRALDAKRLSKH